jgi:hypothetical protein
VVLMEVELAVVADLVALAAFRIAVGGLADLVETSTLHSPSFDVR